MRVLLNQDRLESSLKEVTNPFVSTIEALRVAPVELMHPPREIRFGSLQEQVVVIAHQNVGMDPPEHDLDDAAYQAKELLTIDPVAKDLALFVASARDMPERAGVIQP